jgi:hypothetical protein
MTRSIHSSRMTARSGRWRVWAKYWVNLIAVIAVDYAPATSSQLSQRFEQRVSLGLQVVKLEIVLKGFRLVNMAALHQLVEFGHGLHTVFLGQPKEL